MASTIDKEALTTFITLLDRSPQSLISFEHAVELMTQIGFSCRLACQLENWNQSVTFCAPLLALSPAEAAIETPFGSQQIVLEQRMSLARSIESALQQLRSLVREFQQIEAVGMDAVRSEELAARARTMERDILETAGQFQRSGSFKWPMDRFQLQIGYGDRSELVTICGPFMASLSRASLADETQPGIGVSNIAEATVKLLMDRTIERGRSIGTGFRAREEGEQLAKLLREHLASIQEP